MFSASSRVNRALAALKDQTANDHEQSCRLINTARERPNQTAVQQPPMVEAVAFHRITGTRHDNMLEYREREGLPALSKRTPQAQTVSLAMVYSLSTASLMVITH